MPEGRMAGVTFLFNTAVASSVGLGISRGSSAGAACRLTVRSLWQSHIRHSSGCSCTILYCTSLSTYIRYMNIHSSDTCSVLLFDIALSRVMLLDARFSEFGDPTTDHPALLKGCQFNPIHSLLRLDHLSRHPKLTPKFRVLTRTNTY